MDAHPPPYYDETYILEQPTTETYIEHRKLRFEGKRKGHGKERRRGETESRKGMQVPACEVRDGRWEMGASRWEMGDGRWEMGDGRWEMEDGRCDMGDWSWEMGDAKWEMCDVRWEMGDGR